MDTATLHALVLAVMGIAMWYLVKTLLRRAGGRPAEGSNQKAATLLPVSELKSQLKEKYARRARYRLGVFAGCALALVVYFFGGHRLLLVPPLLVACACQYCVYRNKTTECLTELMQRRMGGACTDNALEK